MRYIDTGSRDATKTLAHWLEANLVPSVVEVRCQSGFFTDEPLGLFAPVLQRLAQNNGVVRVVVGSNKPGTLHKDVLTLAQLVGLPRANAKVGVVQYATGLFHPKTLHFRRSDGSQCAYVGSSNLTGSGVRINVEAGVIFDTLEGDPSALLDEIAIAVDAWFTESRVGLHLVSNVDEVQKLTDAGILILVRPPIVRTTATNEDAEGEQEGEEPTGANAQQQPARLQTLAIFPPLVPVVPPTLPPAVTPPTTAATARQPRTALLMRVRPRRDGKQLQISMKVLEASFMNGAREVVSSDGSRREIGYNEARGVRNTARFEAPEMVGMANPVVRFRWTDDDDACRVLQVEVFDADSGGEGAEILRKLEEGITSPPVTNLEQLSQRVTVLSKSDRAIAQWYRLDSA